MIDIDTLCKYNKYNKLGDEMHCVSGRSHTDYSNYGINVATISCEDIGYPNYTLVDCEGHSPWREVRGGIITQNNTCILKAAMQQNSKVSASINCCNLKSSYNNNNYNNINNEPICIQRKSSISTLNPTNEYSIASITCQNNEILLGCTAITDSLISYQGSCIGSNCVDEIYNNNGNNVISHTFISSDNTCNAITDNSSNIYATGTCCSFNNNHVSIDCHTIWSEISGNGDDDPTYVTCNDIDGITPDYGINYFMSDCSIIKNESNYYDGGYFLNDINGNNDYVTSYCRGFNGAGSDGTWTQALCCNYTFADYLPTGMFLFFLFFCFVCNEFICYVFLRKNI